MTDQEKTQIIDELIGKCEGQFDTIHILLDQTRKNTISTLQTLREEIEQESIQKALDTADKVNKDFERMVRGLGI